MPSFQSELEWPELCAALAEGTVGALGRKLALELRPAEDEATAELRLSVMKEVLSLHAAGAQIPAFAGEDLRATLLRVERGAAASGSELASVVSLLRGALRLDRFGQGHAEAAPLLGRMLWVAPELLHVERELSAALEDDGTVCSDASPELADARRALRRVRDEIKSKMGDLISRYREALQDGYFAERDGRYVLPVRVDAPFKVEGLVLGTSGSGSTLYIEPKELAALGNRLRLAEGEVERQEAIVLARLSETLAPLVSEVGWAQEVAARSDLLHACAQLATRMKARVADMSEAGEMTLLQARHPLLSLTLESVVPSDLSVSPGRGLVLSGPNAGGKTVALKTLGLFALMHSAGLAVPAEEGTRIGFFDDVRCDIGDDQNLSMSLSTFSGHVQRVAAILDDAGHGTLVLFDELMGGTDPEEGAVLAIATLDALTLAEASVCVTTHYEPLKQHAARAPQLDNGSVGFDFERMEPTFLVTMGRAGASSALVVAQKHGLPGLVTERARKLLPEVSEQQRVSRVEVETATAELQRKREELDRALAEQTELQRRLQLELEKQKESRRKALHLEGDELRAEVRHARAEVRRVLTQLKGADAPAVAQLQKELDNAARVGALGGKLHRELSKPEVSSQPPIGKIQVGAKVHIKGFPSPVEVVEAPKKGQVKVLMGVMKMSVPLSDLVGDVERRAPAQRAVSSGEKRRSQVLTEGQRSAPVRSEDVVLDLRGRRVEESLLEVDHFVDELLRRQETGGFVLHGHGTGALKDAVRTHLRAHECVVDARPAERDEGGDAFTVFWLPG